MSNHQNRIRDIILEEGIEARNVVSWRVPKQSNDRPSTGDASSNNYGRGDLLNKAKLDKQNLPLGTSVTTASMRLWKLIFENVLRSVDELHRFCEDEQSAELAEQGFLFCLSSCRDFAQLAQRFEREKEKDKEKDKEKLDLTMPLSTKHKALMGTPTTVPVSMLPVAPSQIDVPITDASKSVEVFDISAHSSNIETVQPLVNVPHHQDSDTARATPPKLRASAAPFVPRSVTQGPVETSPLPCELGNSAIECADDKPFPSVQHASPSASASPAEAVSISDSQTIGGSECDASSNNNRSNKNRLKSPVKKTNSAPTVSVTKVKSTRNTSVPATNAPVRNLSKASSGNAAAVRPLRVSANTLSKSNEKNVFDRSTESKKPSSCAASIAPVRSDQSAYHSRRSQSCDHSRCDSDSIDPLDALDLSEIEQLEVVRASEAVWAEAEAWIEAEVRLLFIFNFF